MRLESVDGEEMGESLFVLGESMENGIVLDAEVSPEEVEEGLVLWHCSVGIDGV